MKSYLSSRNAIVLYITMVGAGIFGIANLKIETDASIALLPKEGKYLEYRQNFPSDYGCKILVTLPPQVTQEWWQAFIDLHYALEDLKNEGIIYRVESLVNARFTTPIIIDDETTIALDDFIFYDTELDQQLWDKARAYPPYREVLVNQSRIGYRAAINIIAEGPIDLNQPAKRFDAVVFDTAVSNVVAEFENRFTEVLHVGEPRVSAAISDEIARSTVFIGIVLCLMVLIVKFDTGYWRLGFLAAWTGGMGLYFAWASMGYFGVARNPINDLVVQMIIPIGAAFVIHAYHYRKQYGKTDYRFFLLAVVDSFGFATFSTVIGFGATGISPYPAIQQFGIFGVVGIVGCFLTTLTLVFPILVKLDLEDRPSRLVILCKRLLGGAIKRPVILSRRWTFVTLVATMIFVGLGLRQVVVDYVPVDYLSESNPKRQEFEQVRVDDAVYSFAYTVSWDQPLPGEKYGRVIEPALQIRLDEFNKRLEADPRFVNLRAFGVWEQLIQIWTEEARPIPTDKAVVAAELFLSFSDPHNQEFYFNETCDTMATLLQVGFKGSRDFQKLERELSDFAESLSREFPGVELNLVGRVPDYFRAGDIIAKDNIKSLVYGAIALTLIFIVMTRSFKVGCLAMIPNIVPVLVNLALLGWLNVYLDIGASIVSAIALGLVVDDTGHFLVAYLGYRRKGKTAIYSVCKTLQNRTEQILVTSLVIVIGFIPMLFAPLVPFHTFAVLLGATMLFALIGDLIILPSLLVHFDRRRLTPRKMN